MSISNGLNERLKKLWGIDWQIMADKEPFKEIIEAMGKIEMKIHEWKPLNEIPIENVPILIKLSEEINPKPEYKEGKGTKQGHVLMWYRLRLGEEP